jgi:hypothetical protein
MEKAAEIRAPGGLFPGCEVKSRRTNSARKPPGSIEPADPVGEFVARLSKKVTTHRIELEAHSGTLLDDILRAVAEKGSLDAADATDLVKIVQALRGPGKLGPKHQLGTSERAEAIARNSVAPTPLSRRKLAEALGMTFNAFEDFLRNHADKIETAKRRLNP